MNDKKKIYLANPYGFSTQQKEHLLPGIIRALHLMRPLDSGGVSLWSRVEVWEPFARNDQVDFSQKGWAYRVAQKDVQDVIDCDAIFAVVNGTPPDEGVMIELGIAMALGKKIFLFRDDFRKCCDSEEYPLNLMVFAGLPKDTWRDYYYTSVAEISDPAKAYYKWVVGQ